MRLSVPVFVSFYPQKIPYGLLVAEISDEVKKRIDQLVGLCELMKIKFLVIDGPSGLTLHRIEREHDVLAFRGTAPRVYIARGGRVQIICDAQEVRTVCEVRTRDLDWAFECDFAEQQPRAGLPVRFKANDTHHPDEDEEAA